VDIVGLIEIHKAHFKKRAVGPPLGMSNEKASAERENENAAGREDQGLWAALR
jgi:hypothetical protein